MYVFDGSTPGKLAKTEESSRLSGTVPRSETRASFSGKRINQVAHRLFHMTSGTFRKLDDLTEAPTEEHPTYEFFLLKVSQQGNLKAILTEVVSRRVSAVDMKRRQEKESWDSCQNKRTTPAYEGLNLQDKVCLQRAKGCISTRLKQENGKAGYTCTSCGECSRCKTADGR